MLSSYLSDHGHGRRRSISATKIMPLSSVTMPMAEFDFLVSFLQGLYLAKMSIFPILVDHGWIISITVKRPVTRYIISSELQEGSLKVAIAKRIDLEGRIKHEERKLNEIQDPKYSDDQRDMIEGRINKLRGELTERNKEIDILKGEASKQINQIRESITKLLDKETGTLGERIRTLFKEQGITIVSILTAVGMTIGVLIESLLGGPRASAPTSGGTTTSDEKGGAREWIKNKLKALSQLLGKLADKALASLPGIIGSILSWILNRAKEVVGWLSQNLWALITGVGVLIYTYFMTKTNRR